MGKLAKEHQAGLRQGSVLSSRSDASEDFLLTNWDEIRRQGVDIGLTPTAMDVNKTFILEWLANAIEEGAFEEDPALVHPDYGAETPAPQLSRTGGLHPDRIGPETMLSPSTSGFRSSAPTMVDAPAGERPSEMDEEIVGPMERINVQDDEPPVRVSLEGGPSISRQGTDLFGMKWREIAKATGGDPEAPVSLVPTTKRRKSSNLNQLIFKLFSNEQKIIQAASDGDAEEIQRLLGLGVDVNTKDKWGWTAMSMAAYGGHEEVARVLMSHGATLDHEDVDGDTPYTLAYSKGHRNLVMMIEEETTRRATEDADKPEAQKQQERKASTSSLRKWKTR
jgi:hypothetical protein